MKMAISHSVELDSLEKEMTYYESMSEIGDRSSSIESFNLKESMDDIWNDIGFLDKYIQENRPFNKIKENPEEAKKDIKVLLYHLFGIALKLEPLLPETSKKIKDLIKNNTMPEKPLFMRKD
jgi:methionyl-tRNA synthetase